MKKLLKPFSFWQWLAESATTLWVMHVFIFCELFLLLIVTVLSARSRDGVWWPAYNKPQLLLLGMLLYMGTMVWLLPRIRKNARQRVAGPQTEPITYDTKAETGAGPRESRRVGGCIRRWPGRLVWLLRMIFMFAARLLIPIVMLVGLCLPVAFYEYPGVVLTMAGSTLTCIVVAKGLDRLERLLLLKDA